MTLQKILPFAHDLLAKALKNGGIAVDATMGNGNDTLRLAELVGRRGHVYAFDIQAQALTQTKERLQTAGLLERTSLYLQGHETVSSVIPPAHHGHVQAITDVAADLHRTPRQLFTHTLAPFGHVPSSQGRRVSAHGIGAIGTGRVRLCTLI